MSFSRSNKLLAKFYAWKNKHLQVQHYKLLLAIFVGMLSGLVAVTLKNTVHLLQEFLTYGFAVEMHSIFYFIYPFVGLALSYVFLKFILKKPISKGIPSVLWAIKKKKGLIQVYNGFGTFVLSVLTIGFGGSSGLEGPIVSTSSTIGSFISRKLNLDHKTVLLMIGCAASGGMAGIFNAPLAALVFVLEVFMFDLTITSMIPLLAAAVAGALTSQFMLGDNILFNVELTENFDIHQFPYFIILGVLTGLVSVFFNRFYEYSEKIFDKLKTDFSKLIVGGLSLGVLIFLIPPIYGEGFITINNLLLNNSEAIVSNSFFYDYKENELIILGALAALIIFKAIATALTVRAGGMGIFAPSLMIGATTGFVFASTFDYFNWADLSIKNFTLVGMAGLIAGMVHAPLTSLFLIAEITKGYELMTPLIIVAAISYLTSKYFAKHSIYNMQLAKKGEILTHHKDKTVLTMLNLEDEIERDCIPVIYGSSLRDLVKIVEKSHRNIFPVIDEEGMFKGIITLDDIRDIMFKSEYYDIAQVNNLMFKPLATVTPNENLESVMDKFTKTGYWNLPIVENGKYIGFISKSKLFNAYRKMLVYFSEE